MSSTNSLEVLKKLCEKYQKEECVYKISNHISKKLDGVALKWLVVMRKCHDTITNESRENVINKKYAQYRANKLEVVAIFNTHEPALTKEYIVNYNEASKRKTKYTVGQIVRCHAFDYDVNEVCSGGIHYFRRLDAAYFYGNVPEKYTGKWMSWYDDGRIRDEKNYVNGEYEGVWTTWYKNGKKHESIECLNGVEEGLWIKRYENGVKNINGRYSNGIKEGLWTIRHENGQKHEEGNYFKGEKNGEWTTRYMDGKIQKRGNYSNGKKEGLWVEWYNNQRKQNEGCYKGDRKHGLWEEWNQNGCINSKGNYVNGFKDGLWEEYYEGGYMTREKKEVMYCYGNICDINQTDSNKTHLPKGNIAVYY